MFYCRPKYVVHVAVCYIDYKRFMNVTAKAVYRLTGQTLKRLLIKPKHTYTCTLFWGIMFDIYFILQGQYLFLHNFVKST